MFLIELVCINTFWEMPEKMESFEKNLKQYRVFVFTIDVTSLSMRKMGDISAEEFILVFFFIG